MSIGDDDNPLDTRVEELIDRGLTRYSNGEIEGALSEWKHALALDPDSERAANYLHYVEEHHDLASGGYEILSESTAELFYPFGLVELGLARLSNEELEEYESFEIVPTKIEDSEHDDITAQFRAIPEYDVDDGWIVDEGWSDDLVNKSEKSRASLVDRQGTPARSATNSQGSGAPARGASLEVSFADLELDVDLANPEDVEPTQAREGRSLVDAEIADLGVGFPSIDELPRGGATSPSPGLDDNILELGGAGLHEKREEATRPGGGVLSRGAEPHLGQGQWSGRVAAPTSSGFDELELDLDMEPTSARAEISDAIDAGDHDVMISFDEDSRRDVSIDDEKTIDRGGLHASKLVTPGRAPTEDSGLLSLRIDELTHDDQDMTHELLLPDIDLDDDFDATPQPAPLEEPSGEIEIGLSSDDLSNLDVRVPSAAACEDVLAVVTADAPKEDAGARTQFIVSRLIKISGLEYAKGNRAAAAVAVAYALDYADDNAWAQKLVFENERRIVQILIGSLGELGDVPTLAVPLGEIPIDQIEHRAAFLLTRVDGQLTLDEILDVSGMPRMEALRHLSRVQAKGFLTVS